jgi:hypothetical protein
MNPTNDSKVVDRTAAWERVRDAQGSTFALFKINRIECL